MWPQLEQGRIELPAYSRRFGLGRTAGRNPSGARGIAATPHDDEHTASSSSPSSTSPSRSRVLTAISAICSRILLMSVAEPRRMGNDSYSRASPQQVPWGVRSNGEKCRPTRYRRDRFPAGRPAIIPKTRKGSVIREGFMGRSQRAFVLSTLMLFAGGASAADVKLVYIGEISGSIAVSGGNFRDGIILAVEEINAKGGILKEKIALSQSGHPDQPWCRPFADAESDRRRSLCRPGADLLRQRQGRPCRCCSKPRFRI